MEKEISHRSMYITFFLISLLLNICILLFFAHQNLRLFSLAKLFNSTSDAKKNRLLQKNDPTPIELISMQGSPNKSEAIQEQLDKADLKLEKVESRVNQEVKKEMQEEKIEKEEPIDQDKVALKPAKFSSPAAMPMSNETSPLPTPMDQAIDAEKITQPTDIPSNKNPLDITSSPENPTDAAPTEPELNNMPPEAPWAKQSAIPSPANAPLPSGKTSKPESKQTELAKNTPLTKQEVQNQAQEIDDTLDQKLTTLKPSPAHIQQTLDEQATEPLQQMPHALQKPSTESSQSPLSEVQPQEAIADAAESFSTILEQHENLSRELVNSSRTQPHDMHQKNMLSKAVAHHTAHAPQPSKKKQLTLKSITEGFLKNIENKQYAQNPRNRPPTKSASPAQYLSLSPCAFNIESKANGPTMSMGKQIQYTNHLEKIILCLKNSYLTNKHRIYLPSRRGGMPVVSIYAEFDHNGHFTNVQVIQSSGNSTYDTIGIEIFQDANSSMPRLPQDVTLPKGFAYNDVLNLFQLPLEYMSLRQN